ncbi:glycosyltransferase family protein [Anditalea andensis]|uniref:Glycosyl transferase n=1 Tax=Anditalea andensis TaxID=1048983 RepID=A0A074L1Z0_9BACT|nr:glycosyltransferase family protein [Anditalea andensis]KEO75159.1 hypothetical protein EL17_05685 [Anditalea andensis]
MKILYAFQGTGNGHISRALEIIPALQSYATTDLLISGTKSDLSLPHKIKYRMEGLSYQLGHNGGIDFKKTIQQASLSSLYHDIRKVPIGQYDLIINDFEPITAWACTLRNKLCISLSHQYAVLSPEAPQPKQKDLKGIVALKYYAPSKMGFGFHFQSYNNQIHPPVISRVIRETNITKGDHVTVYLSAYSEEYLLNFFAAYPQVNWEIFTNTCPVVRKYKHIKLLPLERTSFIQSMGSSYAVLCGAGFETPAEAIYMGKRLAVVPTKHQYEQSCNAAALRGLGVTVIETLTADAHQDILSWLNSPPALKINYPEQTDALINKVLTSVEPAIMKPIPALYYSRINL